MWAGYHAASGSLRPPTNLTLVTLPACAPELDPVERLWLYLRQHYWSNRTDPDIDALEEAAVAGWGAVGLRPDKIKLSADAGTPNVERNSWEPYQSVAREQRTGGVGSPFAGSQVGMSGGQKQWLAAWPPGRLTRPDVVPWQPDHPGWRLLGRRKSLPRNNPRA